MTAIDPEDFLEVMKKLKPQIEILSIFTESFEGKPPISSSFYADKRYVP